MYTISLTDQGINILDASLTPNLHGLGTLSGLAIVASPRDTTLDIVNPTNFVVAASSATAALAGNMATFMLNAGNAPGMVTLLAAGGEANGGSYDLGFNLVFPTGEPLQVEIIPEPMTLSLLALGGLGLIRRRRA